jgi:hypothetical protein
MLTSEIFWNWPLSRIPEILAPRPVRDFLEVSPISLPLELSQMIFFTYSDSCIE